MSSARLPGKVLRPLDGRPLLGWLHHSLTHCALVEGHAIATSEDESDDPIAAWAEGAMVMCVRGPLDHVARRVAGAARSAGFDVTVRVSGDSPLLQAAVVDQVIDEFVRGDVDVASNVRPRSFPAGQSVEVVRTELLEEAAAEMTDPFHREHVMTWFYDSPDRYRIRNVSHSEDLSSVRMTVDTPEDAVLIESVLKRLRRHGVPHWKAGLSLLAELVRQADPLEP